LQIKLTFYVGWRNGEDFNSINVALVSNATLQPIAPPLVITQADMTQGRPTRGPAPRLC
jgi:hypothetical protein